MAPDYDMKVDESRDHWGNKLEFSLSLLGYAVSVMNIIRFPYLVLHNGGGSFLIPYFLCLFICGIPIYYLEMVMGQSSRKSCLACWDHYAPAFKGVGYAIIVMNFISVHNCQSFIVWIMYYIGASVVSIAKWDLLWNTCNASWNTANCVLTKDFANSTARVTFEPIMSENLTELFVSNATEGVAANVSKSMTGAEEFWQYNVLQLSDSIQDVGYPNWPLCIAHGICWIIVYFCLWKGVKSVGKVVWMTATAPYILITIFLIRAVILPGSMDGIKFYLTPDFEALKNKQVWILGFLQIFHSLGPGWGGITTMASYNKVHHKFQREAVIIPIITGLTSFYNGFVIFSCAGFIAHKNGVSVKEAMSSGPGLAFITYPEVTTHLPGGPIWAFLFFLMMFMVGIDTLIVMIETFVSAIKDELPTKRYRNLPLLTIITSCVSFGFILYTKAGMYIVQLIDWYFAVVAVFLITILELVTLIWIYRYQRLDKDIRALVGSSPPKYLAIPLCGVLIPVLLTVAMVFSVATLEKPAYGSYVYPDWAPVVGWLFGLIIIVPIPVYAVWKGLSLRGNRSVKRGRMEILWRMWRPWKLEALDEARHMTEQNV